MFNGVSYIVLYNINFSGILNFRRASLGIMVSLVVITEKLRISPYCVSVQNFIHIYLILADCPYLQIVKKF